jgi:hypothetical protein
MSARLSINPEVLIEGFWLQWKRVEEPYASHQDIWMRYWEPEDVVAWAAFILNVLPRIVAQITSKESG